MRKFLINMATFFFLLVPAIVVFDTNYPHAHELVKTNWPQSLTAGDQHGIYLTFKEAFEGKVPLGINNGWVGVGYLSLIGFFHKSSAIWTTPNIDASFVYNGVFYSVLAVFLSVLLSYLIALNVDPKVNRFRLALGCMALWISAIKLTSILSFTWLPWSHYASAFVGIFFIFGLYQSMMKKSKRWIFLCSFMATLFLFSRRHEAVAVFTACGLTFAIWLTFKVLRKESFSLKLRPLGFRIGVAALGAILALRFISFFSNSMPLNFHYAQQRQTNTYINEYLKIYPQMIPLRFVQTFVDPNFYSYGSNFNAKPIFQGGYQTENFGMPMIYQLPILWYLVPLAMLFLAVLAGRIRKKSLHLPPVTLVFLAGFLSFFVLTCGYLATAVWGGVHLRNGLVREFILATMLFIIACGPGLTMFLARERRRPKLSWQIPVFGILIFGLVLGQLILPKMNWKGFASKHISPQHRAEYSCQNGKCTVQLGFKYENGQEFEPPFGQTIINFYCGEGIEGIPLALGEAGLTRIGNNFEFDVIKCPSAVKMEIYPLFTGYCGTGQPYLKFYACPSKLNSPNCQDPVPNK